MSGLVNLFFGAFIKGAVFGISAPVHIYRFFAGTPVWWGTLVAAGIALWFDGQILRYLWQSSYFSAFLTLLGIVFFCGPVGLLGQKLVQSPAKWLRAVGWAPAFGGFTGASITGSSNSKQAPVQRGAEVIDSRGVEQTAPRTAITFGRVPIARETECQHVLLTGTTGAGKTQAMHRMLDAVRQRQQPAIIADVGGVYLSKWGNDNCFILNPFDARDAGWNPFLELKRDYDCDRMAKAAIPDADGDSREWNFYAQNLFGAVLSQLWKRDEWSTKELIRLIMAAEQSELADIVKGTSAAPLTVDDNAKMLASTRSVAATYLKAWEYLPECGEFSIRDWVQEVAAGKSNQWLFLTVRDDQKALLRNLIATYLDLAILEGLSVDENPDRRIWYMLDELDTLGKVGSLRDGLTKLRKYGGSVVTGIQSIAQLQSTYGRESASVLAANLNTKLLLRAGDPDTAEWGEKTIGQQEIERRERSSNKGTSVGGSMLTPSASESEGEGFSDRRVTQATVLASELMQLPDLSGFLGTPGQPWQRVQLDYMKLPDTAASFMESPTIG